MKCIGRNDFNGRPLSLIQLNNTRIAEVAVNLIDIYTAFAALVILHSDNGREFVKFILTEVHSMYSNLTTDIALIFFIYQYHTDQLKH